MRKKRVTRAKKFVLEGFISVEKKLKGYSHDESKSES